MKSVSSFNNGTGHSSTFSIFTWPGQALSALQDIPVTKLMFLEGLASQGKDIKKGPESCAGVTQIEHNVLQLLKGKEQLVREEPGKFSQEHSVTPQQGHRILGQAFS